MPDTPEEEISCLEEESPRSGTYSLIRFSAEGLVQNAYGQTQTSSGGLLSRTITTEMDGGPLGIPGNLLAPSGFEGETMAAMGQMGQLEFGQTDNIGIHQPPLAGFAVSKWTLGVAVNFRYRPLSYAVDDAIYAALQDGRIAAIYADYGMTFQEPER